MAQLNVSETQLNQSYAVVKAGRESGLRGSGWRVLEDTKKVMIRQVARLEELNKKGDNLTEEEKAEKAQLESLTAKLKPIVCNL